MEIERKWLLDKLPDATYARHYYVEQAYISTNPEVRVRKKLPCIGTPPIEDIYRLTIKGDGTLSREEIELVIPEEFYNDIMKFIGKPAISKDYYIYYDRLGNCIEVSIVDNGKFIYAEVEFSSEEEALAYKFPWEAKEVTDIASYKMKNYWLNSR